MLANTAYSILWISFLLCIYSVIASIIGLKRSYHYAWLKSAQKAILLIFPLLSIANVILLVFLINGHYEISYVARVSSNNSPLFYKIVALWGGQEGSICFWTWLLSGVAFIYFLKFEKRNILYLPWLYILVSVIIGFFILLMLGYENPFQRLWLLRDGKIIPSFFQPANSTLFVPRDGNGLNPLLRHWGMIFHPPFLYLGFVTFTIPYAYLMAVLIVDPIEEGWINELYPWIIVSWLCLSAGLFLGARWAYDVLSWGGYWGWDPVEIAALLPWLSMTAYIHSSIAQVKRSILKRWNIFLIIITYILVVFGTFISRSGLITSVHAFANSTIGIAFFIFLCLVIGFSLWVLYIRWEFIVDEDQIESLFSKEVLFIISTILFISIIGVNLWGILFPIFSELISGQSIILGAPYYEKATTPLFIAIVLLMTITPFISWRKGSIRHFDKRMLSLLPLAFILAFVILWKDWFNFAAFISFSILLFMLLLSFYGIYGNYKNTRSLLKEGIISGQINSLLFFIDRIKGKIIHIGIVLIAIGIFGVETLQSEKQVTISPGEKVQIASYTIEYQGAMLFTVPDGRNITRAVLKLDNNSIKQSDLYPRKDYYPDSQQVVTIPSIKSSLLDDLYIVLLDWQNSPVDKGTFRIYRNPFAIWIWIGSVIFFVGSILLLYIKRSGFESDR